MKIKFKMFGLMAGALFCAAGIVTAQAQNLNGTLDPTFTALHSTSKPSTPALATALRW